MPYPAPQRDRHLLRWSLFCKHESLPHGNALRLRELGSLEGLQRRGKWPPPFGQAMSSSTSCLRCFLRVPVNSVTNSRVEEMQISPVLDLCLLVRASSFHSFVERKL